MTKEKILAAIQSFCKNNTSRQREDLYDYLNKELGLNLDVYDYDGTGDHARFACDAKSQAWETDYVLEKLSK
jgi:hypothetical protein